MTCSSCHPRRGTGCELCADLPAAALAGLSLPRDEPLGVVPSGAPVPPPVPALEAKVAQLRSLCGAAADEIEAHWSAHTDLEGCGPVDLIDRLRGERGGGYCDLLMTDVVARLRSEAEDLRGAEQAAEASTLRMARALASEQGHADGLARALRILCHRMRGLDEGAEWDAARAALAAHDERRAR